MGFAGDLVTGGYFNEGDVPTFKLLKKSNLSNLPPGNTHMLGANFDVLGLCPIKTSLLFLIKIKLAAGLGFTELFITSFS